MTTEEWRPVVGYEGLYEVSDQGRVRGLDRLVSRPGGPSGSHVVRIRGRVRAQYERKRDGYVAVSLCRDNRSKSSTVHRLVAAAFLGPCPEGLEIRHLDGDKTNNTPSNLAHGTSLENSDDVRRHGTHANARKTHCRHGHPYDSENTYVAPTGGRYCVTCRKSRNQSARAAA